MLNYEIVDKHEGLRLLGSADDFRRFHAILHDVNERSPVVFDKEGVFIALAYDVRKAYEGQRLVRKATKHDPYSGPMLGVDILWPTILVQCRMFRVSLDSLIAQSYIRRLPMLLKHLSTAAFRRIHS